MTCTPAMGSFPSLLRSASAGGQLEQPSDVNSSTTTGTRSGGACDALPGMAMAMATIANRASFSTSRPSLLRPSLGTALGRLDVDRDLDLVADHGRGFDHAIVRQAEVAPVDRPRR